MGNLDTNGNGNVSGSGAIVTRLFQGKAEQRAQRERHAMLELVRTIWVEGVLEKSLYAEILIRLGLEEQPGAGERPWDMLLQTPDQPNHMLPPGTPVVEVFDAVNGSLLILGEPGAGKTTMLLELARDTIARAGQDAALPIPVVFNLSSWIDPQQPLADWVVAELRAKYYAPKATAQRWVEHDELLLLLDGLDEIRPENREACIQAINNFHQAHGLRVPLVVCCRIADYEALYTKLHLQGTILLQPLTSQQVEAYFDRMGEKLATVCQAWKQDSVLQELVRQPLMLNILTLAYQGLSVEELASMHGTLGTRRKHLFDTYIRRMTNPSRTSNPRYTPEQTTRWLAWLAQKMSEQGQSIFLLEQMRRNWLQTSIQRLLHRIVIRLVFGLIFGLLFGLIGGLGTEIGNAWGLGLLYGLILGLFGGLFGGLIGELVLGLSGQEIKTPTESFGWSWQNFLNKLFFGVAIGLGGGLFFGLVGGLAVGLVIGLVLWLGGGLFFDLFMGLFAGLLYGSFFGLIFGSFFGAVDGLVDGLIGGLNSGPSDQEAEAPTELLTQSWKNALNKIVFGLVVGLAIGLVVGLGKGPGEGLAAGLFYGLVFGLIGELVGRLEKTEMGTRAVPNQGIRHSIKNAILLCLVLWLIFGLVLWIAFGRGDGLVFGLVGGLIGGLWYGGTAVISHYTLRFMLCCQGHMPWNYVRFLDYAAKRLFLRKVGGGYIFIHRVVMEYFASLSPDS